MSKNYGKLHPEPFWTEDIYMFQTDEQIAAKEPPVLIKPKQMFWRAHMEDGTPWKDTCDRMRLVKDDWFIAVRDDGWICSASQDPTEFALRDADIWRIKADSNDMFDFIGNKWTGTEVVPWDAS